MSRTALMAANWKMNMTRREAATMLDELIKDCPKLQGREVLICPPAHLLVEVGAKLQNQPGFHLGAQNLHWEESGAFTGEISAPMLRDAGCHHVIIGHSERRSLFGETDQTCQKKVSAALEQGLVPVLCVGETLEQREAGRTLEVSNSQLRGSLKEIRLDAGAKLVVAYEPVWAIGTGRTATPEDAESAMKSLRETLGDLFGERIAGQMRLLYGGSVKPDNVDSLMAKPNIDGALVGGASLKAASFGRIIGYQTAEEVASK